MSYDLAVWEGERPSTAEEAAKVFDQMYDELIETDTATPWATGSLIKNASGRLIYFAMTRSTDPRVVGEVAEIAIARGLVCFDPQTGTLL